MIKISKQWDAHYHCLQAHLNFLTHHAAYGQKPLGYTSVYEENGLDEFRQAAAALGYRLVAIEPKPVTSEPGFDNRHIPTSPAQTPPDGGRWNEHSTAQEA